MTWVCDPLALLGAPADGIVTAPFTGPKCGPGSTQVRTQRRRESAQFCRYGRIHTPATPCKCGSTRHAVCRKQPLVIDFGELGDISVTLIDLQRLSEAYSSCNALTVRTCLHRSSVSDLAVAGLGEEPTVAGDLNTQEGGRCAPTELQNCRERW